MTKREKPKRPPLPSAGGSYLVGKGGKLDCVERTAQPGDRDWRPGAPIAAAPIPAVKES